MRGGGEEKRKALFCCQGDIRKDKGSERRGDGMDDKESERRRRDDRMKDMRSMRRRGGGSNMIKDKGRMRRWEE